MILVDSVRMDTVRLAGSPKIQRTKLARAVAQLGTLDVVAVGDWAGPVDAARMAVVEARIGAVRDLLGEIRPLSALFPWPVREVETKESWSQGVQRAAPDERRLTAIADMLLRHRGADEAMLLLSVWGGFVYIDRLRCSQSDGELGTFEPLLWRTAEDGGAPFSQRHFEQLLSDGEVRLLLRSERFRGGSAPLGSDFFDQRRVINDWRTGIWDAVRTLWQYNHAR